MFADLLDRFLDPTSVVVTYLVAQPLIVDGLIGKGS